MSRLAGQPARLDSGHYPVRFAYRTLFSDMDANRHLNNGTIGRLFEEGRANLSHRVFGGAVTSGAVNGLTMLLATITVEFLSQARYPGSIEVGTAVTRVGASSFAMGQAAFQDGECVALADCVMVKAAEGRPVRLTGAERELLARLAFAGAGVADAGTS